MSEQTTAYLIALAEWRRQVEAYYEAQVRSALGVGTVHTQDSPGSSPPPPPPPEPAPVLGGG